jgi:hypothetical protein
MSNEFVPLVGEWFRDEAGSSFKIIHLDEAGGTIEVQYLDGAVEAMDADSWSERELVSRAPPEDWSAAYDDIEASELDETEAAMRPHEWGNPLDTLDTLESDD